MEVVRKQAVRKGLNTDMSVEEDITAVSMKAQGLDVTTIIGENRQRDNQQCVIMMEKVVELGVTMTEQIAKKLFCRNVQSRVFAHRQDTR